MPISNFLRANSRRLLLRLLAAAFLVSLRCSLSRRIHSWRRHRCHRRQSHRRSISLVSNGQVVASAISAADGSFQLTTGVCRPFLSCRLRQSHSVNCKHPTSTLASLIPSSATSCWSRHGCANRSSSLPPARRLRSRKPAPPPPSSARSISLCATISSALCVSCPALSSYNPANSARKHRSLSAAATPTTTRCSSTASMPATWAINSILARSPPRLSKAPKSIAVPIRISSAPVLKPASSASPPRTAPPASLPCSSKAKRRQLLHFARTA